MISEPVGNILFDVKISGSLHFTPSDSYEESENDNSSSVHWDLVLIQRKDGLFVLDEMKGLNP